MDIHRIFRQIVGKWKGNYRLWLAPDSDAEQSSTTAEGRFVAGGKYLLLEYTWVQDGHGQEGVFLLGGDQQAATATWGDSWHMAPQPMICDGALQDDGKQLVLNGHYAAGEQQWGWRTELILPSSGALVMQAWNITPDGQEALAVKSEMERVLHADRSASS